MTTPSAQTMLELADGSPQMTDEQLKSIRGSPLPVGEAK